jgi:hypothetical protein
MFGTWGKKKITSGEFVELFYDFAHTVSFGGLEASKTVYDKYFPGVALETVGTERMVFMLWWLDVKLVEAKSQKRSDVMLGVIGKYLQGKGVDMGNLLESKQFADIRLKFADYYDSVGANKDGNALVNRFIQNIAGNTVSANDSDRKRVMDANLAEIVGGIESGYTSKYDI